MTATMKAAVGGGNGLELREVPRPTPKPNEILVKVHVAGLNRADLGRATSPDGTPAIPGSDWAGEVVDVGKEAQGGFKPGDRVMCSGRGGYAEYAVSDWGRIMPMPTKDFSYEQAATLPVALLTMHDALITNGRLKAGERVLIQGASAGVGLMALQIAKLKGAGLVVGTSTNAARRAKLKDYGADLALDTSDAGWVKQVLDATGGKGADLVVDQLTGKLANQTMEATALLGRIVNVGRLGGQKAEFNFDLHALKRIDYIGVTFRTRTLDEVREIARRMRADLWDAVAAGKLRLPVDRVFALAEADAAQAYMRNNQHFGKILLKVAG